MRCAMVFALSGMLVPGAAYALDLRMPGEQKLEQSDGERALGACQAVDDVVSLTAPQRHSMSRACSTLAERFVPHRRPLDAQASDGGAE